MSPISWLRRVCSLLRDHKKKGITEWHNLIMCLGVSPRVLRHFGNLCIPHYDRALCLFSPRLPFSTSLFRFSPASLSFGLSFPASRVPFPVLSLIPSAPSLYPFLPSHTSASLRRRSDSLLLCSRLLYLDRWRTSWPTTSVCQRRRSQRRRLMRPHSLAQRGATPPRS